MSQKPKGNIFQGCLVFILLFLAVYYFIDESFPSVHETLNEYDKTHEDLNIESVTFKSPEKKDFNGKTWYNYFHTTDICLNNVTEELKREPTFRIRVEQTIETNSGHKFNAQCRISPRLLEANCFKCRLYPYTHSKERLKEEGIPFKELIPGKVKSFSYQLYIDPCLEWDCIKDGILQDSSTIFDL